MNALVGYRANAIGHLTPTPEQRAQVAERLHAAAPSNVAALKQKMLKAGETESRLPTDEIDKDQFLELLVMQMQYQDPLDPVNNEDMLAQLAQFSSLEQMNNLNEAMTDLTGNIDQLNFISAGGLIGRDIVGVDVDGNEVQGVVDRVHLDGSLVHLGVGGQLVSMAGVFGIQ